MFAIVYPSQIAHINFVMAPPSGVCCKCHKNDTYHYFFY